MEQDNLPEDEALAAWQDLCDDHREILKELRPHFAEVAAKYGVRLCAMVSAYRLLEDGTYVSNPDPEKDVPMVSGAINGGWPNFTDPEG